MVISKFSHQNVRHRLNKQTFATFGLFMGLYLYASVVGMYLFLPPLIGVCFVLFVRFDEEDNFYAFLAVIAGILCLESENNLPMGILLGLYLFLAFLVIPKLEIILNTPKVISVASVLIVYLCFYILMLLFQSTFDSEMMGKAWMLLFYVVCEVIIVMFL